MTPTSTHSVVAAVRRAWAALHLHGRARVARAPSPHDAGHEHHRLRDLLGRRPRVLRKCAIGTALLLALAALPVIGLSWRLGSGPLSLDLVTPWLTSAVEERFGGRHRIEVGGTQLERTDEGGTALRLLDIVVRDNDGIEVARAPKAEVGISGLSLLSGHVQAERLSLIGVSMAVRIETDGQVSISAGASHRAIGTAPPLVAASAATARSAGSAMAAPGQPVPVAADMVAAALTWLDDLDAFGLDGQALTEIGLKNGSLVVDDRRGGKQWNFEKINLSVTRPKEGGVALAVNSTGADGPWSLTATVTPRGEGRRAIEAVVRDVSPNDLLLAFRVGDGRIKADMPISGIVRAEIERDGTPRSAEGRILVKAGYFLDPDNEEGRLTIDDAQVSFKWDEANRQFLVPIELTSSGNRFTLLGHVDAPREPSGAWGFALTRGMVVLGPDQPREAPLVFDRVSVRGRFEPAKRRIVVEQGEISGATTGGAFSGVLDWSTAEPQLTAGIAATRMNASAMKRLWPIFVQSKLRKWVLEHVLGGTADRIVMAVNAPLAVLKSGGPPAAEEAVSVDISGNGATIRPIDGLPPIHDADLVLRATGRTVTIRMGHAAADLPSGRKLTMSNGLFEVTNTHIKPPPARVRFRMEGGVDAAAELVAMEPLRETSGGLQLDPANSHGTFGAQVAAAWTMMDKIDKKSVAYTVDSDVGSFVADKLTRGVKVESSAFKLSATPQGIAAKGDFKVAGVPTSAEYRRASGSPDTEIRAQALIDDKAIAKLGLDWNGALGGVIPVKLNGRIGYNDRDGRFAVEADLTQVQINDILPGWIKPSGKAARATFVVAEKPQGMRFEDIVIDGPGTLIKGFAEVDAEGEVVAANFSNYAPADGDKVSLKAERSPDGTLKVTMRGEVLDGRNLIKSALGGGVHGDKSKHALRDYDLDIKVGAVAGFNGETLRSVDLTLGKRAGQVRNLGLNAKLGRDTTPLIADLRAYRERQVIYLETNDAGALMRFVDIYSKMIGGQMWVAMDPPGPNRTSQDGLLNVRDFSVRGEPALERITATGPIADAGSRVPSGLGSSGVQFSRMRVDFVRQPGKLVVRDGLVWGPAVGATIEGQLDYARNDVKMRGTFVPAYAVNNIIPRILPFVGPQNEGLFAVTFEVVGQLSQPTLRVNPVSGIAPGFLRKLFEYQGDGPVGSFPRAQPDR